MTQRRSFEPGDRIIMQGKAATVVRVEKRSTLTDVQVDMGRYFIRYDDGSTLSNAPGYLMERPGAMRRRG